jgi:hypothetical protein
VKIHHSIFVLRDISEQVFSGCGIQFKQDGRFEEYDITEDDPRWPRVAAAISRYQEISDALRGFPIPGANDGDRVWTEFSDEERKRAPFLEMGAWYHGYPQPQDYKPVAASAIDKLPYLRGTYDSSEACQNCWTGRKQIAPFRMKKSPAWGRRSILQLEWEREEFFVKPDVYESIFRPFGIGFRPVLLHKTGAELDTVVQLVIDAIVEVQVRGIPLERICSACGEKDYHHITRGFPPSPEHAKPAVFKSRQVFNGYRRRVYVSNGLYRKIVDAKLKGADFAPCEPESATGKAIVKS